MKKIVIIIIFFINGCNDKQIEVKELITNNRYKYWLVDNEDKNRRHKTIYYFDTNGKWLVFIRSKEKDFYKYDGQDVVLNERWQLINDSLFNNGVEQKIIILNDSLFVFDNKGVGKITLRKCPDSLIPKKFQKLQ